MGRFEEAMTEVARIQMLDPLDSWAINESYLIASQSGKRAQAEQILSSLKKLMRGEVQSYLEKAVACDPDEPQYYAELDELYEKAGEPLQKRLALLEKNQAAVEKRGDALMREISLLTQTRHYDRAIQLLDTHHFRCWEGNERIAHDLYVDAHLQRGESLFQSKKYTEALRDFESALEYPDRFELGKPSGGEDRTIEAEYHIGRTYEMRGELPKARIHYQLAITPKLNWWSELSYFQGLAHQKLSQETKARELFRGLVEFGRRELESKKTEGFYSKFGNAEQDTMRQARSHYLIGLGLEGEGKNAEAKIEFQQVLKLNTNHPGARFMLGMSAQ